MLLWQPQELNKTKAKTGNIEIVVLFILSSIPRKYIPTYV
jgi:hypothetical protein